ncbi:hypothetical protein CCACVL1_29527 [Corchorus capsularis]|uniref:Uncharacterized protein n=1 Tax=Corchorus capsularis TaxID=210143 RepID=A0A1R3G1C0_COCAP|nr:hypothetical protein CCACVL1_29527 [Corchorus capsularis]
MACGIGVGNDVVLGNLRCGVIGEGKTTIRVLGMRQRQRPSSVHWHSRNKTSQNYNHKPVVNHNPTIKLKSIIVQGAVSTAAEPSKKVVDEAKHEV